MIGTGIFYILCILVQTWGFGTDAAGVNAFASSISPLGDLADSYVGSAMEDVINAGATLSAFASALAATAAGGRILYALARDTPAANLLGRTSTRTGAPAGALAVTLVVGMGAVVVQRIAGVSAVNAFFYPGTLGVLSLLVAYIVTNLGAIRYLFIGARRAPLYEIVCPIIGIAFLGYTLYKNVSGVVVPLQPVLDRGRRRGCCSGSLIVVVSPGMAKRIGIALARDEGLEPTRVTANGGYRTREDQSTAASTTDTSDTTRPMSQPAELLEDMIAAIATPMATIPPVAITRTNVRSSTPRPLRAGSMFGAAGAPPPPERRWARLALRLAAADGSGSYDLDSGSDDARGSATDSREGSLDAASSSGSAARAAGVRHVGVVAARGDQRIGFVLGRHASAVYHRFDAFRNRA